MSWSVKLQYWIIRCNAGARKLLLLLLTVLLSYPGVVRGNDDRTFRDLIEGYVLDILENFLYLLIGIAFLVFLWGVAKFIWSLHQGDNDGISGGKQVMLWGVIALFVIVSIGGLVALIQSGIFNGRDPFLPESGQ